MSAGPNSTSFTTGYATVDGTRRFRDRALSSARAAPGHFRRGPLELDLSSFGLGSYLGRPDGPTDLAVEQATQLVVRSGRINMIDTAINYRYQRAERSIGRALGRQFDARGVERDEVFVATKVGYLAPDGESPLEPRQWIQKNLVDAGVLAVEDIVDGSHAMSPSYLRDQVARSRSNLGLATLDLVYLHNAADAQLTSLGPREFERRLKAAFAALEEMRHDGWLRRFGLATWDTFRVPRTEPGYLSLEEVVGWAREVGGPRHGFAAIQFPFNSLLPEAALRIEQPVDASRYSTFEAAERLGIACITSVPLSQGQLARHGSAREGLSPAQAALQFARSAPGTTGPVVGLKQPEHLSEALALADRPPWDPAGFARALS